MHIARLFAFTLLLTFLAAAPALAQYRMPIAVLNDASPASNSANMSPIEVSPAPFPDAPVAQAMKVKEKVMDKKFITVMAALGGAETLRFTTRQLVIVNEFAAGAPWVTSVPSNQHLVAKYGALYATELLVAYELKKPHTWLPGDRFIQKFWWAYPAAMAPIHIKNGVRNIRTQAPSCPVEECQMQ